MLNPLEFIFIALVAFFSISILFVIVEYLLVVFFPFDHPNRK